MSSFQYFARSEEKKDDDFSFTDKSLEMKLEYMCSPKMIVFDKDGTLGDCTASLRSWAHHMTKRLSNELALFKTTQQVEADVRAFHLALGWDPLMDNVVPSAPLAAGTWEEQVETAQIYFNGFGIDSSKARLWHEEMGDLHSSDSPVIDNLKDMILECRKEKLLVSICTSDDRRATDKAILSWGLTDLIDLSICGNEVTQSKPSAQPLQILCEKMGIHPSECIVVGDTTSDTCMARNAGAGLCIGVLTGSGTTDQLLMTGADIVLPHVGYIPKLLREKVMKKRQNEVNGNQNFTQSILSEHR